MNKLYWLIIYHISNTVSKNVIAYSSIFKININNITYMYYTVILYFVDIVF